MKKTALILALSGLSATLAYADQPPPQTPPPAALERDPAQTAVNAEAPVNPQTLQEDLLRQQKLTQQGAADARAIKYTGRELVEHPEILEDLFIAALVNANKAVLPTYIMLYEQVPNPDRSLIDWAKAVLQRDTNLNDSVASYRKLLSTFPENNYIRFQLAETLFYNQEFEAAKGQFERLRAAPNIQQQDVVVFDKYLDAINQKEDWNFSFGINYLNDKNLGNSAKQGTQMILPNGNSVRYNTPRQEGQGLGLWFGADKRWSLSNGKYLALDTDFSSKYYWNNKSYNDVNAHLGFGVGYADARFNIQVTPFINKRWYGGGLDAGKALQKYSNTYGASVLMSYWLSQKVKYTAYYNYGYEMYDKLIDRRRYDGAYHLVSNALMYLPSATQYWSVSLDFMRKHARDKTNAYERIGARLTWGQEWPLGLNTSTTLGIAKRDYKAPVFFSRETQQNNEYSASVSLWHKKVHYAGFTPKVTWSYTKTDSNIPIYSYDKSQVFLEVSKSF